MLLEAPKESLFCAPLVSGFWWLQPILGTPWLVDPSLQPPPLHLAWPVHVNVKSLSPFSYKDIGHWICGSHETQDDLMARSLITHKVTGTEG